MGEKNTNIAQQITPPAPTGKQGCKICTLVDQLKLATTCEDFVNIYRQK